MQHVGNLAVGQVLDVAQDQHFAVLGRQAAQFAHEQGAALLGLDALIRRVVDRGHDRIGRLAAVFAGDLVERDVAPVASLRVEACEAAIAHDRQPPRARIAVGARAGRAGRAHERVVHGVGGVRVVAEQPAPEVVRGVEMAQRELADLVAAVRAAFPGEDRHRRQCLRTCTVPIMNGCSVQV